MSERHEARSPQGDEKIQMSLDQLELDLNRVKNMFKREKSREKDDEEKTTYLPENSNNVKVRRRINHNLTLGGQRV